MALANVALTNTFDEWRLRTNQIIAALDQNDSITYLGFDKANSANYFTFLVNANTTAAFDKANSGNIIASAAFDRANTVNTAVIAAFTKANNALANTTDITFNGNLKYTGNINVFAIITHANQSIGAANSVLFSDGRKNYWYPMLKIFDVNNNQIYP